MSEHELLDGNRTQVADSALVVDSNGVDGSSSDGIVTELAMLPREAHINIRALAKIFDRTVRSVERAIRREDLPAPFKLMGKRVWMVGAIVDHFTAKQQAALRLVEMRDLRRASGG